MTYRLIFITNLFIVFFILLGPVCGENVNYYFKQLSTEQGLSQSTVKCILNDHNGLIWIGTKNGLNKYDQYELKNYYKENTTASIPDNCIYFVAEDSLYNIWIGTAKGLSVYNKLEDNFTPIFFENKPLNVYSFLTISEGIIFGGYGELYIYFYESKQIERIDYKGINQKREYNHIIKWKQDHLIVASRYDGICSFDLQKHVMKKLSFIREKDITAIFVDKKGRIWLSPYKQGLYCYDVQGKEILHLTQGNSELNNDVILDIIEKDERIWLATDGGGINVYDPVSELFEIINNTTKDAYSLAEKSILCLYNDIDNNLWAGSIRGGLIRIKEVSIRTYKDVLLNNPYGLSDKVVVSLYEDPEHTLWIGTDGGGINSYNPYTKIFTHYLGTYPEKVVSIAPFSDRELVVSFFSKGVFLFNKITHTLSPFTIVDSETNKKECLEGSSVYIDRCSEDKILFLGKRIYIYDKKKNYFSTVDNVDVYFQYLLQRISTNDSVAYLMGYSHLAKLNYQTKRMEVLYNNHEKASFSTASYDGKDKIWVGTNDGLFYYSLSRQKLEKIETNLFHGVSSLVFDDQERLWIGAQNMLFCYLPDEKRFIILGESDGVSSNELFHTPVNMSYGNIIYLGGASGLICINKDITFESYVQPTVQLADVILNGKSCMGEIYVNDESIISIPWNISSLEIKLSTKEKDIFRKKVFRYCVVGMNKNYIESYSHTLSIGTLPPGDYTIMASCSSQNGIWSPPIDVLHISVVPPVWKRWWFISILILILILVVIAIFYSIIHKKQNELKWKMREHEKRTDEEKIRFLINISHELRTPLTLVYAPLKRILNRKSEDSALLTELNGILKQVRQMKNIINMVLDVRKMEVGQDTLHLTSHQFNQWVCSVTYDFLNEFETKDIKLICDFDENISEVFFDSSKCEIILSNLLMNALKFSASNSEVKVSTRLNERDGMVRVSVTDQGIGLQNVDLSRLFTRFYQGNHDRNGSGIGLSYAKVLVEMHKGKIGAFNNEDCGATFYIDLPLTQVAQVINCEPKPYLNELLYSEEQKREVAGSLDLKGYSVLVVEDEPELREFIKDTLKELFSHVYVAEDGMKALNVIQNYLPDIIISDVMMPRMNGFELCENIKNNSDISHIPVILLTARSDFESNLIGYKIGADAYLSKPFEVDYLIVIIGNLLKNRERIKYRYKNDSLMPNPQESTISNADEQFLLKLNKLIYDNMDNPNLDVKFVTENIGMSRASLYNKLKNLTDMGVNDYINKLRIEKAVDLLSSTDLSITEVSELTGFIYQRYFSSVFKQIKGVTPSKFRQEQRGK